MVLPYGVFAGAIVHGGFYGHVILYYEPKAGSINTTIGCDPISRRTFSDVAHERSTLPLWPAYLTMASVRAVSRARYTSPIPPAPIGASTS
jgi:hypothetical protein